MTAAASWSFAISDEECTSSSATRSFTPLPPHVLWISGPALERPNTASRSEIQFVLRPQYCYSGPVFETIGHRVGFGATGGLPSMIGTTISHYRILEKLGG